MEVFSWSTEQQTWFQVTGRIGLSILKALVKECSHSLNCQIRLLGVEIKDPNCENVILANSFLHRRLLKAINLLVLGSAKGKLAPNITD